MRDELTNVNEDGEKITNFQAVRVGMKIAVYESTSGAGEGNQNWCYK